MNTQVVAIDPLRSLAHGSISGSFAAVGTPLTHPVRVICITNATDGDMLFSTDGVTNMLFLAAGTFKLFDLNTNRKAQDQYWVFPIGTQFYVAQSSASTRSGVYIEVLWGE